jgi:hypothetical protein
MGIENLERQTSAQQLQGNGGRMGRAQTHETCGGDHDRLRTAAADVAPLRSKHV